MNLNQLKETIRKNWKLAFVFLVLSIIILASIFVIGEATKFLASIAIRNESMLMALVEAEATILGFFGLIVVYALTSFDNRIDRLEEQLFKLTAEKNASPTEERLQIGISKRKRNLENQRTELLGNASGIGVCLVLSLLFSVLSFGGNQMPLVDVLSELAIFFLFFGIGYIFWMFRKLNRRTETAPI